MSTYLELCQKARREARIGGSGPTTVTGQSGQLEDIVEWVKDAYKDIQLRHIGKGGWRWMRRTFTLTTTADDGTYASTDSAVVDAADSSAINLESWDIKSRTDMPQCYLQTDGVGGEYRLTYLDWDSFKQLYRFGTQTSNAPHHISIDPQNNLVLGPAPDGVYIITGDYHQSPQELTVDASTPDMPARFHDLIVWYAIEKYGFSELADEIIAKAKRYGGPMMRALERSQLPVMRKAGPLA